MSSATIHIRRNASRVTWLLPVKDAMPFLPETLASIEAQTHRDFEVLAWDNGSTDGSLDVLRQWVPKRLPGRVIAARPMGLGASLAAMVEAASTELCARIDGDDVNHPDRLALQVAYLRSHPRVAVLGSNVERIDGRGEPIGEDTGVETHDAEIRWRLRFCNALRHPTVMFRRSAVLAAGNYRDLTPGQDYDLWLRVASAAAMANLPARLVRYRVHAASVSATRLPAAEAIRTRALRDAHWPLFPGLREAAAARLMAALSGADGGAPRYADIRALDAVAAAAARAAREEEGYFRRTRLYRRQRGDLLRRWLKAQPGAATLWPLAQRVARLVRPQQAARPRQTAFTVARQKDQAPPLRRAA